MMNNFKENISNINFFKDRIVGIKEIDLGHSGAFTYYVTLNNNNEYFLKIIESSDLKIVTEVYSRYLLNKIKVPKLIEFGKYNETFSYYIYESLGRITLKEKMKKMTVDEIYDVGVFIGKENKKLSNSYKNKINSSDLAMEYINRINKNYIIFIDLLKKNKDFFTIDEYNTLSSTKLKKLLAYLFDFVKNENVIYCHNDIKTNNIMFKHNELYFIDIENTSENFFYRTLGANIFTIFPKSDEKYVAFYNGVLAGFYDFDIPDNIKYELVLSYLSQMLKKINHCIIKKNDIHGYINHTKLFSQVLNDSCYFEKTDFSFLKTNKKYELLDIEIKRICNELEEKFGYTFLKKINGGYSGAISLQLTKNNKKFFCKIFHYPIDFSYVEKITNIYKEINVNSLKLLDYGTIFNDQYYFVIYNYIDGICLNDYIKEENLNKSEILQFGIKIGEVAKKLKCYKNYNESDFEKIDILEETKKIKCNIMEILSDSSKKNLINKYITIDNFNKLIFDFVESSKSFKNKKNNLIHQDLKSANIIISNDNIYIIDIESMALSHNVFDFKCTLTWDLIQSYEYEINYLKGYFNGLYNYKIPKVLGKQLKFIFLYDFFRSLCQLLNDNNINYKKIDYYINGVVNIICKKDFESIFDFSQID